MRRTLPVAIAFTAGMIMILDGWLNISFINTFANRYFMRFITVSSTWAVGLGALNVVRIHVRAIGMKRPNYGFSYVLLFFFFTMIIFGVFLERNTNNPFYQWLLASFRVPLSTAVYSLNSFYLASACYRTFRARSLESGALLIAATFTMIGSVPMGGAIWGGFPIISDWIIKIVNDAVIRAFSIGLTLGTLSQTVRNLVGIERGYMAAGE
ncbi:MAG: hypothetical protein FWF06_07535 [Symbiobacteriaceae bacterium]|nr:hypothetical protein [Symbiobacteriaceae bacterium]